MVKVYIDTLGCAKNEYDSSVLAAELVKRGCEVTDNEFDADYMIVNTCGFINDAKKESIERIFELSELKDDSPHKKLIVTGCLSQRYHDELCEEMPEVDLFTGVNDYVALSELISEEALDKADATLDAVGDELDMLPYRTRLFENNAYSGVLKIAEGCDNACAFCAIPSIRGSYRSKSIEDCVHEAEDMAARGITELILIAQDTSQYGKDLYGEIRLPQLLRRLCEIDGIKWIRLMYVYDNGITDELIETIASEEKICKYIDIPIQHVSDNVLNAMRRQSSGDSIKSTINKLRSRIPDICIRTTLLVGFPGETDEDFNELLKFIDTMKLDRLGAFAFSDEEGTASYLLPDKVDDETKQYRWDKVMEHQLAVSEEINQRKIGRCYEILIDEVSEDGVCYGRTAYDSPEIDFEVSWMAEIEHKPGEYANVKITNAFEYDLEGEEVLK